MKKIGSNIKRILQSDLAKNSAKLLSANVIAQAIGLLVYPILTRLYLPADFGLFNLFISIGSIVALVATAEYQYAIVLPKEEKTAVACFHVGFLIACCVTLLCALTIPFSTSIAVAFKAPDLANWYFLLPFYVFFIALWTLLNQWYTRHKNFNNISCYQLSQSIVGSGAKIGFGLGRFLNGGLIVSSIIAPITALIFSVSSGWKQVKKLVSIDLSSCKKASKKYANFPKYSLPRVLINHLSCNLPILLLTPFFGLTEIGFFGMAITLAFRPINMISGSLYQVFFQHTTDKVNLRKSIKPFFHKFLKNTLLIIVPAFTLLYFILPSLTDWLLGSEWRITGEYIQFMLPWLLLSAVIVPLGSLTDIFMKQSWWLTFEIIVIVMRLAGLGLGIFYGSIKIAIIGYCVASAIGYIIQIPWYKILITRYEKTL